MSFKINILSILIISILSTLSTQTSFAQKNQKKQVDNNSWETEYFFTEGEKYFILEDYAKALSSFQKAQEIDPSNAAIDYKLAQIYNKGEDVTKALFYINKALELDKSNKYYYLFAAELNTKNGDFQSAEENYKEMLANVEGTDQYLYELAAIYLYDNKLDFALKTYDQIESKFGINEESSFQKQKIYLEQNKLTEAIAEITKLINAFPFEPSYRLHLAEILMNNKRLSEAIQEMEKLVSEDPGFSRARLMLSDAYERNGQIENSHSNLIIAFEDSSLDPVLKIQVLNGYRSDTSSTNKEFILTLASTIEKAHPKNATVQTVLGDINLDYKIQETALYHYLLASKFDPSDFNVWQNILSLQYAMNQIDTVINYSEQAIELFPNQTSPYYFNGLANIRRQNYQAGIQSLIECKKRTRNPSILTQCNTLLGDAYYEIKEFSKSDQSFEAILHENPNNDVVANNYSYYLSVRKENLPRARELASKLVERNPDNPIYLDTYAWVLYQLEEYDQARKVIEKAIQNPSANAVHFEHYGDILFRLGKVDQAVMQWKKAKELNSDSEVIDKKIADRKIYE